MSELWCQHALGCKTQRASGRGCAALRIWRCSPAPADRRGAPGARARPHTSRGRPRRLGRARRRSGVRSRPSRARIRHEEKKSLLHDNERHGGRAALLRGHALHSLSRVVRRASFRRVLPSLPLSSLVTISSPISSKSLLHDDGRHGGRVPLPRRHAHCACIHAVRRAPLRRAPSPLSLSDVNCFNLTV
jgi:hypothetical protein